MSSIRCFGTFLFNFLHEFFFILVSIWEIQSEIFASLSHLIRKSEIYIFHSTLEVTDGL